MLKIVIVGSFPPPFNGQNIGTKLVSEVLSSKFETSILENNLKWYLTDGASFFNKVYYYCSALLRYLYVTVLSWYRFAVLGPDALYLVPTSNSIAIIRDYVLYIPYLITGRRIYCQIRSGSFTLDNKWLRLLYSKNNFRFLFLTQNLADLSKVDPSRYEVIPNFVDPIFEKAIQRDGVVDLRPLRLIYLSNLFESKGIFEIIEAVKKATFKDGLQLDIYGKGEDVVLKRLEGLIAGEPQIRFRGVVGDREKIREIYAGADLFVLPTTYAVEASPRTIIEAMSQYCVPLVTDHAGIPDMVDHRSAYLINKTQPLVPQLIERLEECLADPVAFRVKSRDARDRYETQFSYHRIQEKIVAFIENNKRG